jgi:host factor-I protein
MVKSAKRDTKVRTASDFGPPTPRGHNARKANNLQDVFLNSLRKTKMPVTMFLVKGVKLQGIITWFDNFSVLLRRDGQSQLIYKHAISTIMPAQGVDLSVIASATTGSPKNSKALQDAFLGAIQREQIPSPCSS